MTPIRVVRLSKVHRTPPLTRTVRGTRRISVGVSVSLPVIDSAMEWSWAEAG